MQLSCWSSMVGLGRNPLLNDLIQQTFKLNFFFVEKFTVIPFDETKLFLDDHNSPRCFRFFFIENKKMEWDFQLGTPRQAKKTSSSWKIIEVTHSLRSHCGRGSRVTIILLKLFFSKFLILSTDVRRRRSPPEITARWHYRLPSNNLTAITTVSFVFISNLYVSNPISTFPHCYAFKMIWPLGWFSL